MPRIVRNRARIWTQAVHLQNTHYKSWSLTAPVSNLYLKDYRLLGFRPHSLNKCFFDTEAKCVLQRCMKPHLSSQCSCVAWLCHLPSRDRVHFSASDFMRLRRYCDCFDKEQRMIVMLWKVQAWFLTGLKVSVFCLLEAGCHVNV